MSVFVFGYTVGTWPRVMTEAERRSKGKSFKVIFFSTFIYIRIYKYSGKLFSFSRILQELWLSDFAFVFI